MASDDEEVCDYFYDDDDAEEDAAAGLEEDSPPPPRDGADYWAITQETVSAAQKQDLSTVMNLLSIKQYQARALLIHHRWRIDGIYDSLDKGREHMLRNAGIVLQENNSIAAAGSTTPWRTVTCNVCFEDFSMGAVSTMDCGHCFCNDCWTGHFHAAVESGKKQIRCMEVKCSAFCDENLVRFLLGQKYPDMAKRFNRFLLESYIEDNASVKWCPSTPNRGHAIRVGIGERYCEVECPCGLSFCFNCMAHAHSPCPCPIWEKWNAKRSEGENIKWILANTKSCPKCFKAIEKNGQCMCWLCGGATGLDHTWTSIAGHSCNRYKESRGKTADTSREQMQRYKHYHDRFKIHGDSYSLEKQKLGATIEERVRLLESDQERPLAIRDGDWLTRAHRRLLVARQALSRSYVFAYYMFGGGSELRTRPGAPAPAAAKRAAAAAAERAAASLLGVARNLFEDQQEQHVEQLSRSLAEGHVVAGTPEAEIVLQKQTAVTLAKTVERLCGEMYKCIQDELLTLLAEPMSIASYSPDGPDRAKELAS